MSQSGLPISVISLAQILRVPAIWVTLVSFSSLPSCSPLTRQCIVSRKFLHLMSQSLYGTLLGSLNTTKLKLVYYFFHHFPNSIFLFIQSLCLCVWHNRILGLLTFQNSNKGNLCNSVQCVVKYRITIKLSNPDCRIHAIEHMMNL